MLHIFCQSKLSNFEKVLHKFCQNITNFFKKSQGCHYLLKLVKYCYEFRSNSGFQEFSATLLKKTKIVVISSNSYEALYQNLKIYFVKHLWSTLSKFDELKPGIDFSKRKVHCAVEIINILSRKKCEVYFPKLAFIV